MGREARRRQKLELLVPQLLQLVNHWDCAIGLAETSLAMVSEIADQLAAGKMPSQEEIALIRQAFPGMRETLAASRAEMTANRSRIEKVGG